MADHDDYESLPDHVSPFIHMMAGGAAGILEHIAMYPFDVVKTRLQKVNPTPGGLYTGVAHCMKSMIRQEGVPSLFRGINAVLLGAGPAHALYFSVYEKSKRIFGASDAQPITTAMSAVCAAIAHDGFMNPVEVVKQRMQVYDSPHRTAFQCFRTVYANEGIGAFYRSFSTQLLMNIPFQCAYLVTYETCRKFFNPDGTYHAPTHLVSGAIAGAFAASITTPLDVLKTFLNTQEACKGALAGLETQLPPTHRSASIIMFAFRSVFEAYGWRGFVRGLSARVVASSPAAAISWSVYEFFKHKIVLAEDGGHKRNI
eukprot:m.75778 g.75778  ORF g.75778 m.75778 type:complete len:314 (-) comp8495_c0_seq1:1616-2557(-)